MRALRIWHWLALALLGLVCLVILWLLLAYGALPRLWSKHEHKKIGNREEIVSYTSQDIPADPINLHLIGTAQAIKCDFEHSGWSLADPLSARSAIGIIASVLLHRPYLQAPVSSLYFQDRLQDLAFEREDGPTAHRRHHIRLWQIAPQQWLGAASYDRGIGIAFTLQVTHHIGSNVDAERDAIAETLQRNGGRFLRNERSRIAARQWQRNGGGDRYITDGEIKTFNLNASAC